VENLYCSKCGLPLEERTVSVNYLGFHIENEKLPRCPKCGQFYVSEVLVKGKVNSLETSLEEK
jgi:NAD-dependent SIR2 family protein deacetylase